MANSPCPELSPRLAETLDAFCQSGITPTHAEIVWLADLRRACDRPHDGSVPWVMGAPVRFSGIDFYPMHRLAESWFMRAMALTDDPRLQTAIYFYAHAHSAPGDRTLQGVMTADDITSRVASWYDEQPIHNNIEQLTELASRLSEIDGDSNSVPDPSAVKRDDGHASTDDLPQFVALACRAFPGILPSFWMTDLPAHEIRSMIASVSTGGDAWATSHHRTAAIANYLKAVKWVWRAHTDG